MSFLPSNETMQMCMLACHWRHLWKSTPTLRIIQGGERDRAALKLNNFVNYLLLLRDRLPLDEYEISYNNPRNNNLEHDEIFWFDDMWICYAVSLCQAQVLKVFISSNVGTHLTRDSALVSQFLRVVELTGLILWGHSLDFSSCPALEDLSLCSSRIYGPKISSQSLRRLTITQCGFIAAPCLISLQLADVWGRAPLLESMPSLVTVFIRLGGLSFDICEHQAYGDCDKCVPYVDYGQLAYGCIAYDNHGGSNDSVLLQGLSGVTSLELTTSDPDMVCLPFCFKSQILQVDSIASHLLNVGERDRK